MKHFFLRILCGRKREKRKDSKPRETKRVPVDDNRCACCLAPFLINRGVRCNDCGARSCIKSCSRWDTSDNAWHCIFCHHRRTRIRRNEKWFENFGATNEEELHSFFGTAKSRVYVAGHAVAANMEQIQEDQEEKRTVYIIRNFVEKIIEDFIDNVDDTSIDRLYKNSEYDKFLEEHRPPLIVALTRLATCLETSLMNKPSMDSPATAHAALKEIVERAVEEARKLPGLGASEDTEHPSEGRPIADHSYEDLLATAILNKVVEKFQRERVDGNSNVLHDTDSPKAKYIATESEHGLEEDAASYMSYRRECNGNHSAIRRNGDNREPVSFMMEEQIEEVTTITSDDDEFRSNDVMKFECTRRVPFPELGMDIVDPPRELSPSPSSSSDSSDLDRNEYSARTKRHVADRAMDLISPVESWEDNWLFQKRRTSRTQPDAVAMLVPSSNAYYKALIGDRDAEDTSDLSECSSTKSDEEIEKELMEAINNVVPRTPRTSECDAKNNSEVPNVATQLGQDEIDICQEIKIEKNLSEKIYERFDEKISEKLLKSPEISEKKTIKHVNDKEKLSESSFALITAAKGEDEAKEKHKDTTDCGERIIAITVESSARKDTQSEKSSERNDQMGNVVDEDEDQRESEYTEHYDTAIQRHLDSLTKVEVCSGENEMINETAKTMNDQFKELENNSAEEQESERLQTKVQLSYATSENHIDIADENDRLSAPPRPGTIAEREHKKWENAPPIENNPYSEENIRKRCLERQYSRNSDIPGTHYDLTKLNEANLEALLAPDCPDIKRFGRDYYINQSKVASGERQEQAARSTMSSMSSRPSSSLSQRSSCTGNEQREQQVSHHELEQFEAASLRGSLPRRRCRDPLASPHFAINPLLHLKLVSGRLPHDDDDDNQQVQNVIENERINDRENTIEDTTGDQRFRNFGAIVHRKENNVLAEDLEIDTHFGRTSANWNEFSNDHDTNVDREAEEPIVPRYDANRGGLSDHQDDYDPGDHDSGIGSRDSMISDRNRWRRLYRMADNNRHDGGEEISSIGGRRFWTTGGYKYHTFGGIRIRPREGEDLDDLEDESTSPPVDEFADHPLEFAKLKFQTFGGIKRSRRIHGSKIPNYRRIRLRPILPEVARSAEPNADQRRDRVVMGKSRNFELYSNVDRLGSLDRLANLNRSTSFEGFASCEHSTSSTFEDSDWQNEEDDVVDHRVSFGHDIGRNRTTAFKTNSAKYRNPIRKKNVNLSSLLSFENEDNEWQDEPFHSISNENIMNKFPSDSSKKRKICAFSDDDNVARRGRETRSRRYREIFEEGNDRKLEKLINRNTKKSLNSSRKLRAQEEKSDDKRHRKLDERRLSDITIW
ncbi:uncharacterized protein LOC105257421 isoform X4 [Camponotus floridanus]|uniref:uncharacterized protein LOC105257421 isoform X4 n=1 Tax=Camponotus floridanus TaxID=104421 RepID=UPI000DC67601|nr:uncharacterized protein LOC105257421 isoform X4 [Camponotus floridanus]